MNHVRRINLTIFLIFALLATASYVREVVAQEEDNCLAWKSIAETVLNTYRDLDVSSVSDSVIALQGLREQLATVSVPPEAILANTALLNMLHLKTTSLVASTSSDQELADLTTVWEAEARAANVDGVRLVNELCGGETTVLDGTETFEGLVIADFNNCNTPNTLGGDMGAAYSPPNNSLLETYPPDNSDHQCVARLEYDITEWAAFWLQLGGSDFSPYTQLSFDIRADQPVPSQIKIELKRAGTTEWVTTYVVGVTDQWQTVHVNFSSFTPVPWAKALSDLTEMEELVFTFERTTARETGVVYIDNIVVH